MFAILHISENFYVHKCKSVCVWIADVSFQLRSITLHKFDDLQMQSSRTESFRMSKHNCVFMNCTLHMRILFCE